MYNGQQPIFILKEGTERTSGRSAQSNNIAAAKAVCMDCSVKELCLEFALKTNQDSGVWGGASEEERRQLRRERNRARRSFN